MQVSSTVASFHTFVDYLNVPVPGIIVPQRVYTVSPSVAFNPRDPIRFSSQGGAGVSLQNVNNPNYHGLANGDQLVHLTDTGNISICIHWPGYPPFSKSIPLNKTNGKLTYKLLGMLVARTIQQWMQDIINRNVQSTEPSADWSLRSVKFESLWLLELRQIVTGVWQPVLFRDV